MRFEKNRTLATLRPTDSKYDVKKGPLVSNVGERNAIIHVSDPTSFGKNAWKNGSILFFVDTKQTTIYNEINAIKDKSR